MFITLAIMQAIPTSDFVIGAYSQYDIRYILDNHEQKFDLLGDYLRNAGFNATTYSIIRDYDFCSNNLGKALEELKADSVKTLLLDLSWQNNNGEIGVGSLSFGNRLQMEAEYMLIKDELNAFQVDNLETGASAPASEEYDYIFKHKTGNRFEQIFPDTLFSNKYAWVCDEALGDSAGVALSHPRKRWKADNHWWPQMLSEDITFFQSKDYEDGYTGSPVNENRLYLTVAMRFDNVGVTQPVANVRLKLLQIANDDDYNQYVESYDDTNYAELTLTPSNVSAYGTTIYGEEYLNVATDWPYGNKLFEFYVDLPGYGSHLYDGLMHRGYFYHINPEIEWLGNGKMIIDYIILEDEFARSLRIDQHNSPFISRLNDHMDTLETLDANTNNILYYYTKDEPYHGQMKMYDYLENLFSDKLLTAINSRNKDIRKHNNQRFNHPKLFLNEASPKRIMVETYPISFVSYEGWVDPNHIDPNPDFGHDFVQDRIDSYVHYYYHSTVRNVMNSPNPDTELFYAPQQYGNWKNATGYWSDHMPPRNMVKCLQLLPLCYAADGVVSFALTSDPDVTIEKGKWVTPLARDHGCSNLRVSDYTSAYTKLIEANAKLAVYGPLIKNCQWKGANKIMTNGMTTNPELNDMVTLSTVYLDDIHVVENTSETLYQGYVQGGFYLDDSGYPCYMLVNRRAVDTIANPPTGNDRRYVDTCFQDANPQTVLLSPSTSNSGASSLFGTHKALFDPFDQSLYHQNTESNILVEIGPGDGKLLQMCASLPAVVADNFTMKNKGILSGEIVLEEGGVVNAEAGTELSIKENSQITVQAGASFTFRGIVSIEDNVTIHVNSGGTVNFDNAICTLGQGSIIEVSGGTLSINGGSLDKSTDAVKWEGIRVSNANLVTICDATISNAAYHQVTNSNLLVTNSRFNIPANSLGVLLKNSIPGYQTEIVNTAANCGIYGDSNVTSKGITLSTMKNPVIFNNVDFQNLYYGISKSAIPYATDVVSECHFVNCTTGISLCNNEYGTDITECSFANNQTGKQGTGINLVASTPSISNCNFLNLHRGVLTEYTLQSGFGMESSITESNFYNCERGIESRCANHRLKANYFNRNNVGIFNHAGSNLNLSYYANNVMMNRSSNIEFYDTMPYEATIQLYVGNNDFYHLVDNGLGISAIDFDFDVNYFNFPFTLNHKIDASKNWFQDFQVTVNDPAYADYVFVDVYCPSPSMPAPPPDSGDRLFMALDYESQEMYELAAEVYKAIIDEQLEEEKSYVTSAIDGLYRCTFMIPNPAWELTDYFDTKALQFAIDDPKLSAILKDYLGKVFVLSKDFQAAVDLIQLRIDNPISEIDSLRAVLDLEIVLQLATMEENKRPLTTKYVQYQYPNMQVFNIKHDANLVKLNALMNGGNEDTSIPIPPIPVITSNYPNPFNPSTTIEYSIPSDGMVKLCVYNLRGQKVKDIINGEQLRGIHKTVWDGRDRNNRSVSSGIYFLRLESGGKTTVRKAMLMK
jgi:hypothetical protein